MRAEQGQFLRTEPIAPKPKLAVVIGGELYFGFGLTRQFLKRAIEEGVHKNPSSKEARDTWTRNIEITIGYVETQDFLEDIGRKYGISGGRARMIFARTIRSLWLNSSKETQRLFPISEIPLHKPISQQNRERISRSGGGRTLAIAEMLREGKTPEEIRRQILPNRSWLPDARPILRKWGLELPYFITPPKQNRELAIKLANPSLSDFEIERLLSQVSKGFLNRDRAREQPLLIPMRQILSEYGFHSGWKDIAGFVALLREAKIPLGEIQVIKPSTQQVQKYFFIVAHHLERAKAAFKGNPSLKRFLKP